LSFELPGFPREGLNLRGRIFREGSRQLAAPGFDLKSGFTLLEVLISLAIVGILIVVILESENLNLKVRENSSLYTNLLLSGNDLLSRVLSGEKISSLPEEENGWEVEEEETDYGEKVEMRVGKPSGPGVILHTYIGKGINYNF